MLSDVVNDILDETRKNSRNELVNMDFKAGFTGIAYAVLFFTLAVTITLGLYGCSNSRLFPAEGDNIARIIFVYAPIAFASFSLLFTFYTIIANLIISVDIRQSGVRFRQGSRIFEVTWQGLVYSVPKHGTIRTLIISDGYFVGRVNSMFCPGFSKLVEMLKKGRAKCEPKGY
jgi:hypothetical protein